MTTAESDIAVDLPLLAKQLDSRVRYVPVDWPGARYRVGAAPTYDLLHEREGSYWVVRDRVTGVFGRSRDLLEAVKDFQRATEEHLDVLERQPALAPELEAQLRYLRARVRR